MATSSRTPLPSRVSSVTAQAAIAATRQPPPVSLVKNAARPSWPSSAAGRSGPPGGLVDLGDGLVSSAALIHQVSRGYPRTINNIYRQALLAGWAARETLIDDNLTRTAISEVI
jgi:hypothetical protein